jgi:hypothetical protein
VRSRAEDVAWIAAILLGLAALYELLVATEVVPMGDAPGDEAPGGTVVALVALMAFLVAAGTSFARSLEKRGGGAAVFALLAPAGAAYLIARWSSFDPYYLPSLRRYADGGVHGPWIVAVTLAAVGAGMLTLVRPRPGCVVSFVVLLVEALTVFALPLGK